jgi:hypothetical protein
MHRPHAAKVIAQIYEAENLNQQIEIILQLWDRAYLRGHNDALDYAVRASKTIADISGMEQVLELYRVQDKR